MERAEQFKLILKRCQKSPMFFIENFCKVKHPKAGIIPFKLFDYQKISISHFLGKRYNIYRKNRQCFAEGSMVWGPNGPKQIEKLRPGDVIYTLNQLGFITTTTVAEVFDNGIRECFEVRSKSGHRSVATSDHEFLTTNGWFETEHLTQNDRLVEVFDLPRYESIISNKRKSEAILIGYLLSDGYCGGLPYKAPHFTNTCFRYLLEFQKHCDLLFDKKVDIKKHKHGGFKKKKQAYRITVYGCEIRDWLKRLVIFGLAKKNKIIPSEVFSWNNESIALLINRMFAGDGWYSSSHKCNEIGIGSQCYLMLSQLKQLLSRFMINAKIYKGKGKQLSKLRILGGPDFDRFFKTIGIFNKQVRKPITKGFIFNRQKGDIKSIKKIGKCHVYDISAPPYDNYVIDGAIVHNCGISTLVGAFILWYGMFFSNKTILIVSKRDEDAKEFLAKNVKFVYDHLPSIFHEVYGDPPKTYNEHHVILPNNSSIKSLTSSKDTLRSNSSSFNVIDEAAFMPEMQAMWSAGQPTLIHGGSVCIVSTCAGVGGWYHDTWEDAVAGRNEFNPIMINWWDMDWAISYKDDLTGKTFKICPREGIRKCTTKEDIAKWGPYHSPWLEEQYRALQRKGKAHLFRQETLAEFIGSGNTVLSTDQLLYVKENTNKKHWVVNQVTNYINPSNEENQIIDFEGELFIWKRPVKDEPDIIENGRIIKPGQKGHTYSMGVDISSGEGDDFSSIVIIDCNTMEQVAELNIKVQSPILLAMMDYLAKWFNGAFVVPERQGLGIPICQDFYTSMAYTNVYKMLGPSGKPTKKVGFATTPIYKPLLNKALIDYVGEEGVAIYGDRLSEQLQSYIHLGQSKTGHTEGAHSDIVIAFALALVGIEHAIQSDHTSLSPRHISSMNQVSEPNLINNSLRAQSLLTMGGMHAMMPIIYKSPGQDKILTVEQELMKFTQQLGGLPIGSKVIIRPRNK